MRFPVSLHFHSHLVLPVFLIFEIFIEMVVNSHWVLRNNTERFYVPCLQRTLWWHDVKLQNNVPGTTLTLYAPPTSLRSLQSYLYSCVCARMQTCTEFHSSACLGSCIHHDSPNTQLVPWPQAVLRLPFCKHMTTPTCFPLASPLPAPDNH